MKPIIAIVGRANVGKSTLFNRLLGKAVAIVEDLPGTTRDRIFGDALLSEREVTLVDTGGLEMRPGSSLVEKVKEQVEAAIAEADIIVFITDVQDGLLPTDWEIAEKLRRSSKPVVLIANKADNPRLENQVADFVRLGIGIPLAISAYHGRGINELIDKVVAVLPESVPSPAEWDRVKLAIVGRPNVGKSTLLNIILGEERAVVDQVPGTTRDALDTVYHYDSQEILLIDTAGIRRRGRIEQGIEYYGVIRALRAIDRCDVALLVIDATEPVTAQDLHIAGYVKDAAKGMIIVVNKWDLIPKERRTEYRQLIEQRLKFMPYVPVFYVSAKLKQGVDELVPQALSVRRERQRQLEKATVDEFVKEAVAVHELPRRGTRRLEVYSAYQSRTNPPSFVFVVNEPKLVHFSYKRFLENRLRRSFGFYGTPISLIFKKSGKMTKGVRR